jgi:catechol 2,3-dioxygenase-like lactoylglutathione lyase family enzyme
MLDHVGFDVADYERSKAFYVPVLQTLGLELLMEPAPYIGGFGFRSNRKPFFWIGTRERPPQGGVHVAFSAGSREIVDEFHAAAMAAGATDNGGPGVREIYHPNYYAAFVLDPDGNNIEAVSHSAT